MTAISVYRERLQATSQQVDILGLEQERARHLFFARILIIIALTRVLIYRIRQKMNIIS